MVENSLEKNGPKILLPQIVDTVKALQKTAQEDGATATASALSAPATTTTTTTPASDPPEKTSTSEVVGPLDLPLPINIPGLNTGRKEPSAGGSEQGAKAAGGIKKEGTGEQTSVKVKPKTKTGAGESGSSSATSAPSTSGATGSGGVGGGGGGGGGGKTGKSGAQKSSQGKVAGLRQKEKEDKSPTVEEKAEGREKEATDTENDLATKEKGKGGWCEWERKEGGKGGKIGSERERNQPSRLTKSRVQEMKLLSQSKKKQSPKQTSRAEKEKGDSERGKIGAERSSPNR